MRKNQNGVSMVSLVITIIVIIILAAVAFTGSQETISRAGFSGFVTDIDSVRTAFITEGITNLMGEEEAKNNTVSAAQAYNFLAKGGTEIDNETDKKEAWLTKAQANAIQCTQIDPDAAPNAIGINLPERTVNTANRTKVKMSFYVTSKGDIFVWPPYEKTEGNTTTYYINDKDTVTDPYGTPVFQFASQATVNLETTSTTTLESGMEFTNKPGVIYDDAGTGLPAGLESTNIYQSSGDYVARTTAIQ